MSAAIWRTLLSDGTWRWPSLLFWSSGLSGSNEHSFHLYDNVSPVLPQILLQVTILHELHENKHRLGLADHPNQFDHMFRAANTKSEIIRKYSCAILLAVLHSGRLAEELNALFQAGLLIDRLHSTVHQRTSLVILELISFYHQIQKLWWNKAVKWWKRCTKRNVSWFENGPGWTNMTAFSQRNKLKLNL